MKRIKLDATDSTNTYLKKLMHSEKLEDFTIVSANQQLNGRGQMGTQWESEAGKNLTFSVLKYFKNYQIQEQFLLNIITSLAVYNTLKNLFIPNLRVKWPNDILSGNFKICGILIENNLKNNIIQSSIIGFGLNVNQLEFGNLKKASSLKKIKGKTFNLDEVLTSLVLNLNILFNDFESGKVPAMRKQYEKLLFRMDKPSTFKDRDSKFFTGYIRGISKGGNLVVELEDSILKEYAFKELELLH
ncbi:biotin--[acetyl-CoA-carboxylase] ligase [uncultured Eudoraea sp.]|jgi:BirA family biotin operon repressor/biotin-[acetyl-CoA-carboxylase] ligase|uniref:biotin--[acetyl-CoA-carboxylase] ligase n=1 Tax=uncultured Eudoraea sp. TaxID=1035614 RepID=UPI002602E115|nr:biotin--[acetyl-CoA-carboxylase] ligase [uncultured Eudoraea sp.]